MKTPYLLFLLLVLLETSSQEVSTPSSLLRPRNHNHHPFDAQQFLKSLKAEPTKQGPVLFPNDAPPPPRPPLIVTARPLVESIARSELGSANTETSQSQMNGVSFVPYLTRIKDYRLYNPSPTFNYNFVPTQIPYADVVKKSRLNTLERDNRYNDYEEHTVLPPIYEALANHAEQRVLKLKEKQPHYHHYKAPLPDYTENYQNNDIKEQNSEYDQNSNYAFSYRVNDQKTGDDFSHSQRSSGSATNGEYRVRLPDGRMQIVSYTADENGYKADVRYDDDEENGGNAIDNYQHKGYNGYTKQTDYVDRNNNVFVGRNINNNAYEVRDNNGRNNIVYVNKNNNIDYTDRSLKNDYVEKTEAKPVNEKEDYYNYPDVSKEYYTDYSSEYNSNSEPHRSKFSAFNNNENDVSNKGIASTVKPSYEELKDLFVTKGIYSTRNYDPVELNVPSTTPVPYDGTTEHVVVIGTKSPNLYTNIRNSIPNIPTYATPKVVVATTPRSYLVSTIASLKNKVHLATKPILSERFIDKINKYLSFN